MSEWKGGESEGGYKEGLEALTLSVGDDNVMYRWNTATHQATKFLALEEYSTDHDWIPYGKAGSDIVAVGYAEGSVRLFNRNGKLLKHITEAHKKCVIAVKWSYDGSALATAGQDGALKIWSKDGNLRTNLVQPTANQPHSNSPIYSISWSPQSDSLLYASDKFINMKPISANQQKQLQWKAHEGLVLKVDWSPNNNTIVSCGQDCKYKVWDSFGRLLYSSAPYEHIVNSVAWSPNGDYFAVGAFNMLRLCDRTGWTYSFEKTSLGSLEKLTWSPDGTLCTGAAGVGKVAFCQVVDKQVCYSNWQATLNDENKIVVTDILSQMNEYLQFSQSRVLNISIGFNDLVVTTATQCYIYNFSNWNTPHIFDLKDSVAFIMQSHKYFCLLESTNGVMLYNYDGKHISNPKIPGAKFEFLNKKRIALSPDVIAVVDGTKNKMVRIYEVATGKALTTAIEHSTQILEIALNQCEQTQQRKLAFLDSNRDLYICYVHKTEKNVKISTICDSFLWSEKGDLLVAAADSKFYTYLCPNVAFMDQDLMDLTTLMKQVSELGRQPQIVAFTEGQTTLRKRDGSIIVLGTAPHAAVLFDFCDKQKWDKAIKLCRFVKEPAMWACLAAVALKTKQLDTAETAFAAIQLPEKVNYVSQLREHPSQIIRNAALALLFRRTAQAEQIYVQNKFYFRAVKMHIDAYRWERALKLARDYKQHIDVVVAFRKKHLQRIGKEETNKELLKAAQQVGQVSWEAVLAKVEEQRQKEMKKQ